MTGRPVIVLGPQRLRPTLVEAVEAVAPARAGGRIAAVTAGWEEREREDRELSDHLGGRVVNLHVYGRAEDVYQRDAELFQAMRRRHDRMRRLQVLYRLRLGHALDAARGLALLLADGDDGLVAPELEAALDAVRRLDAHHLERIREIHAQFDEEWQPARREHVLRHRRELAAILEDCAGLCVAGGHVAILLNRMRLLGVDSLAPDLPLFCWSAGAMAASERVVVFHDSPPQGAGNAEVLEAGLGAFSGIVALPHARRRLRLDDGARVGLLARRFAPDRCVALDEGTRVDWDGERWTAAPGTRRLTVEGTLVEAETI